MKVLQLGKGWFPEEPGGLNRYFYDCTYALEKSGVQVVGLVAGSERVVTNSDGRVQVFAPSDASLWSRWCGVNQAVKQQLRANDIQAVVSHFSLYTFPALGAFKNYPFIVHFHGPWALEGAAEGNKSLSVWLKKWLEQRCYSRAATFIVLSGAFRDILHQTYQIPKEKIHIIPGGVNQEHFQLSISQAEARQKLGWDTDRPIIVVVRRLAKRMGLENLIEAIAQVKAQHPDVLLHIAGKGNLRESLHAQIESLGLTDHVRLLGFVPDEDLPLIYRAANFSVVPTVSLEGFGLIVVESLAAGTPVLGTPIGGIPEILRPFSSDLLFDGSESHHLAQGILEVLSGKRVLPDSVSCQHYVQQNYAWSIIANRLQAVYQSVVDEAENV